MMQPAGVCKGVVSRLEALLFVVTIQGFPGPSPAMVSGGAPGGDLADRTPDWPDQSKPKKRGR